jgi:glycosyltransferase involved in cell wall biosynthesis
MAMERPVISTSVRAEGLAVSPGTDILIADDARGYLNHIDLLLKSPLAAKRLGTAGRRLATEKYDWSVCLKGMERLYDTLLGSAGA